MYTYNTHISVSKRNLRQEGQICWLFL